ncbi:MAG TPA: branched-chain amino acid ABC transporter permease [Pseudonocardiaceae bacterium]|jgi:branched-chain amino acid transport system permease protein|nr:branched-chain amino acid ABC transporter permease [Pseudonocardiaceae bacterium]
MTTASRTAAVTGVPEGGTPTRRTADRARRYWLAGWLVVLAVVLIFVPNILPAAQVPVAHQTLLAIPSAVALTLVMGVAGQVSLATSALLAAGAFSVGLLAGHLSSIGLVTNMVIAAAVGFVLGILVGLPSVRIRGLYLLLATLAFQSIMTFVTQRIQSDTIGPQGYVIGTPKIPFTDIVINSARQWYFTLLIYATLVVIACVLIVRSNIGRAWRATRRDELTATSLGVDVRAAKLSAFAISSAIIAMTGALAAYYQSIVTYDAFTLPIAIQYVAMIIVGGLGSIAGATLGAILLTILPYALTTIVHAITPNTNIVFNLELIIYGIAIIFFLRVAPGGLAGLVRRGVDLVTGLYGRLRRRSA